MAAAKRTQKSKAKTRSNAAGFDLATSPCHLIHRAQQFAADRFADEMGASKITQRQFAVLNAVASNEGLTQTDLVRATGIDRSTLAELVSRMCTRRLLRRARAKDDARANTVHLGAAGRTLLTATRPKVRRADTAFLAALPRTQRAAFVDALGRIAEFLDASEGTVPPAAKAKPAKAAKGKKRAAKPKASKAKPAKAKGRRKAGARKR